VINNQEFSMTEIDMFMAGVAATFSKSEVVVLSIESKAYHEWVISLMDGLQQLGFQNIQIKTYTDQS
jgi:biopolymer transport protein ExbD